jgi:hypothetical protein
VGYAIKSSKGVISAVHVNGRNDRSHCHDNLSAETWNLLAINSPQMLVTSKNRGLTIDRQREKSEKLLLIRLMALTIIQQ